MLVDMAYLLSTRSIWIAPRADRITDSERIQQLLPDLLEDKYDSELVKKYWTDDWDWNHGVIKWMSWVSRMPLHPFKKEFDGWGTGIFNRLYDDIQS